MEYDYQAPSFCPCCSAELMLANVQTMSDGTMDFYCGKCGRSGDISIDIPLAKEPEGKLGYRREAVWHPQGWAIDKGIKGYVILEYQNGRLLNRLVFYAKAGTSHVVDRTEVNVIEGNRGFLDDV